MKTPIKSFEIIKEMYKYFIKTYRELEPNLMICEKEDFDNVENALKEYEKRLALAKENQDVDKIAKRLLALEIVKNKKVNVEWLLESENVEEYNESLYIDLAQEEYDLLEEVLL